MSQEVGVTDVQRNFSDYINRIAYQGERFTLVRGGRPVAELGPVPPGAGLGDLPGLLEALPPLGRQEARAFLGELEGGRREGTSAASAGPSTPEPGPEFSGSNSGADVLGPVPAPTAPGPRRILLDSTVLLDHAAGRLGLDELLRGREDGDFRISVITVGELFRGVERTGEPLRRARRSAWVEAVADRFPLLPGDLPAARAHAELWARLVVAGTRIGPHDLWLAATCVAHGFTLATTNPGRFEALEGLEAEDWSGPGQAPSPMDPPGPAA